MKRAPLHINRHVVLERLAAFGPDAKVPARMVVQPGDGWIVRSVGLVLGELEREGKVRRTIGSNGNQNLWTALKWPDGAPVEKNYRASPPAVDGGAGSPAGEAQDPRSPMRDRSHIAAVTSAGEDLSWMDDDLARSRNGGREKRQCLRCERKFMSEGIHNRLCDVCRKYAAGAGTQDVHVAAHRSSQLRRMD